MAYTIGEWTLPATAEESADSGKLVLCWKRIDGRWRLTADIWNSSVPADSAGDESEQEKETIPVT